MVYGESLSPAPRLGGYLKEIIIILQNAAITDDDNYKKTQEAEANARLYTGDYVKLEMAKALSQNTKFFFSGESSPLGAVLTKIMGENK